LKLILHIGQQKTGTTSLQRFLFDNYNTLIQHKILYPRSLGTEHFKQHFLFKHCNDLFNDSLALKESLLEEINKTNTTTVICSDENLFFGKRVNKDKIVKFLKSIFDEIEVLVYLRRQDLHIPSHYQQSLKSTVTLNFDEWISKAIYSGYYDYNNVLNDWQKYLPDSKFTIKTLFNLYGKDIRYDITRFLGIDYNHFYFKKTQQLNDSIDWFHIPILRAFNSSCKNEKNEDRKEKIKTLKSKFLNYARVNTTQEKLGLSKEQYRKISDYTIDISKKLIASFDIQSNDLGYFNQSLTILENRILKLNEVNKKCFQEITAFIQYEFPKLSIDFDSLLRSIKHEQKTNNENSEFNNYNYNELLAFVQVIINLYFKHSIEKELNLNVYRPFNIENKTLYFLHIAKCGGTSVRSYLNQLFYQGDYVNGLNPEMFSKHKENSYKQWKLISGHLDRTVLNYINPDIIITWLRDPIERFVSAYGRLSQLAIEKNSNLITKSLGCDFFNYDRYLTNNEQKINEAKRFLTNDVTYFGVMNRIQESMDLLCYTLGQIPRTNYLHKNKSDSTYKEHYRSKEMSTLFHKASQADKMVWSYATDLFNERFNNTLHYLWSKYNGYDTQITKNVNFNDLDYKKIRQKLITFIITEIENKTQLILKDNLVYTFDQPLKGEGWSEREWYTNMTHYTLRWINEPKATIYLPLNRHNHLECNIHIPHKLTELKAIYIDSHPIKNIRYLEPNNLEKDKYLGDLIIFNIPPRLMDKPLLTKLEIEVTKVTSPNKLDPINSDKQLKSISLDWIKVLPLK